MAANTVSEEAGLEDRVERLETGQNRIISKLDELLGTGGKAQQAAETRQESHLDRPSSVQEMVAAELRKAEAEKADAAKAAAKDSEFQQVKDNLAKLTEAKPEAPQPRRQVIMWGHK